MTPMLGPTFILHILNGFPGLDQPVSKVAWTGSGTRLPRLYRSVPSRNSPLHRYLCPREATQTTFPLLAPETIAVVSNNAIHVVSNALDYCTISVHSSLDIWCCDYHKPTHQIDWCWPKIDQKNW